MHETKTQGLTPRTEAYLDAIEENIGLLGTRSSEKWTLEGALDHEGVDHDVVDHLTLGSAVGQGEVRARLVRYRSPDLGETVYGASYSVRAGIDVVLHVTHFFDHKPTRDEILLVRELRDVRTDMRRGLLPQTFRCWECGRETHWLDSEIRGANDLEARRDRAEDHYCGC